MLLPMSQARGPAWRHFKDGNYQTAKAAHKVLHDGAQ